MEDTNESFQAGKYSRPIVLGVAAVSSRCKQNRDLHLLWFSKTKMLRHVGLSDLTHFTNCGTEKGLSNLMREEKL